MSLHDMPPSRLAPDPFQQMLDALELARQAVCCYAPTSRTCDCKYGLMLNGMRIEIPPTAHKCSHRHCEHTGCPEIRDLIAQAKTTQRDWWARNATKHERTRHGRACCAYAPDEVFSQDRRTCQGPGLCHNCTMDADRIHAPERQQ